MDEALFRKPAGQLVPLIDGSKAFLPDPLPPSRLDLARLMEPLGEALTALGELRGAARRLPNPWLLIQPMQRQEALVTSAMEGTYTTLEELVLEEANPGSGVADTREVANFRRALHHAAEQLDAGQPIAHRLLCALHGLLLRGVERHRGAHRLAGAYKRDQNYIGGVGHQARFIPPPPETTPDLMAALERFINAPRQRSATQAIIDIALVHYQFETIHPFSDGNGRLGRMLITLLARQWGLLEHMMLYVSPELEQEKERYINLMFNVSSQSAWEEWIAFLALMMARSCKRITGSIDALLALQADYMERVRQVGRSANLHKLVERLFELPVATVPQVQRELGLTYRGAQQLLGKLEQAGIITQRPGTRPLLYMAIDILQAARPPGERDTSSKSQ